MPLNIAGQVISTSSLISNTFTKTIINDGLILHLDAANAISYPGSGDVWYDLSVSKNDMTIYGGTPNTTVGGRTAFNFSANGHYMQRSNFNSFPTQVLTYEAWIYPATSEITSGDRGTIIVANNGSAAYMSWNKSNERMSNYWYNHNPEGYHESRPGSSRGAWHHWCCVWDNSNVHQWTDGQYGKVFGPTGVSTANTNLIIGRESPDRQFSGGIAQIRVYKKALSGAEVLHNFNSTRSRFGI